MADPLTPIDVDAPTIYDKAKIQGFPSDARPQKPIPLPAEDGRHWAMEAIRDYVALLTFNMRGAGNTTEAFKLDRERQIRVEWPKTEADLIMPCAVFEPGDPNFDWIGNVAFEDPETADVFQPGTTVYEWAEHIETLTLHLFAKSKPERRALIAGFLNAFYPFQDISGLTFTLEKYFNRTLKVYLGDGGRRGELEMTMAGISSPRSGRWHASFKVDIRFNLAYLANSNDFIIQPDLDLDRRENVPFTPATDDILPGW